MNVTLSVMIAFGIAIFSPEASRTQHTFSRPTFISATCEREPKWHVKVYEDEDYQFVYRHYGNEEYVPGFFVQSKKSGKWLEITQLSTEQAQLGQSPPLEQARLSVGWDYRALKGKSYAELPLRTSGSINFPDEIVYDVNKEAYHLNFNASLKVEFQTWFWILKKELDGAFGG